MEIQAIEVRFLFALFAWFIVCPANEASSCYVLCFMYYAFEHSRSNWNLEVLVICSELRIEPGPHRWEASALTTAPHFTFMDNFTFGFCDLPSSELFKFVKERNFISVSSLIALRQ